MNFKFLTRDQAEKIYFSNPAQISNLIVSLRNPENNPETAEVLLQIADDLEVFAEHIRAEQEDEWRTTIGG